MSHIPGWYPDPQSRKHRRFWDGRQWTQHRTATPTTFWTRVAAWIGGPAAGIVVLVVLVTLLSPGGTNTNAVPAPAGRPAATASGSSTMEVTAGSAVSASSPAAPASSPHPAVSATRSPHSQASSPAPKPTTRTPTAPSAKAGTALAAAEALRVKGRAPRTGYDRDRFGTAWADTDGNGCDQRDDVLNRDLTHKRFDGCTVLRGTLHDPYTGKIIHFVRGVDTSSEVQIDHVVAESDAWQTGAQRWTAAKRLRFATDTLNLYAVDGPTNESKGDGDTATWLPPHKSFRCTYVAHQVAVKRKYHLWATSAERTAMVRVLSGCSSMKLPKRQPIPNHPAPPAPQPKPTDPPAGSGSGDSGSGSGSGGSSGTQIVHPGAFCSPEGAIGVTSAGTPMVCKTTVTDDRARWRSR